jgi:hypothetical protein
MLKLFCYSSHNFYCSCFISFSPHSHLSPSRFIAPLTDISCNFYWLAPSLKNPENSLQRPGPYPMTHEFISRPAIQFTSRSTLILSFYLFLCLLYDELLHIFRLKFCKHFCSVSWTHNIRLNLVTFIISEEKWSLKIKELTIVKAFGLLVTR